MIVKFVGDVGHISVEFVLVISSRLIPHGSPVLAKFYRLVLKNILWKMSLEHWTPRQRPQRIVLEGQFAQLEPLDPEKHGDQLYDACAVPDAEQRFKYLWDSAPKSREEFDAWIQKVSSVYSPFSGLFKRLAVLMMQLLMDIRVLHYDFQFPILFLI